MSDYDSLVAKGIDEAKRWIAYGLALRAMKERLGKAKFRRILVSEKADWKLADGAMKLSKMTLDFKNVGSVLDALKKCRIYEPK